MRHCDVESFLSIGRVYQEIAPMEKRVDIHVDTLRREEFRVVECVNDVAKCVCLPTVATSCSPVFVQDACTI